MNDRPRKPAAFSLPADATAPPARSEPRRPAAFDDAVTLTPDAEDPFIATTIDLPELAPPVATPRPRRLTFGRVALGALGLLVSLAVGLWIDALIRDLFSRNDWLGYLAIGATAVAVLALLGVVLREAWGLDFVVVNGENASGGMGLTGEHAKLLLDAGADVVTLGDHAFDQKDMIGFIEKEPRVLRPINFAKDAPGIVQACRVKGPIKAAARSLHKYLLRQHG